jgi:hypothetical protein
MQAFMARIETLKKIESRRNSMNLRDEVTDNETGSVIGKKIVEQD